MTQMVGADIGASLLYWRSIRAGTPIANLSEVRPTPSSIAGNTTLLSIQPESSWGGRVYATWKHLSISGLYMRSSESSRFNVPLPSVVYPAFIASTNNNVILGSGEASNRGRDQYWRIRSTLGVTYSPFCDFSLKFSGGVRYINLSSTAQTKLTLNISAPIVGPYLGLGKIDFQYEGGGIETGLDLSWKILFLELRSQIYASALIGPQSTRIVSQDTLFSRAQFDLPRQSVVSPGLDLNLGLAFNIRHFCLEVGYSLHNYWNVYRAWNGTSAVIPFSLSRSTIAGFAGPYLTAGIDF